MKVLVTGGSGFVGNAVRAELASRGIEPRLAVRSGAADVPHVVVGSIDDTTEWGRALEGIDVVIHLAAIAHTWGAGADAASLHRTNVLGTERLALAAAAAGVPRLIFLSSVKAIGEESGAAPFDETTPPRPTTEYGRSKLEAERRLAEVTAATSLEVAILRPPLVYGPGVKANFRALLRAVDRGIPLPLASIRNARSLIYSRNLASAIVAVAATRGAGCSTWLVSDRSDVSTPALVRAIARALGRPPRLVPCAATLLELLGAAAGRRDSVRALVGTLQVDAAAIERDLGWTPPCSLEEGLGATAAWYRETAGS